MEFGFFFYLTRDLAYSSNFSRLLLDFATLEIVYATCRKSTSVLTLAFLLQVKCLALSAYLYPLLNNLQFPSISNDATNPMVVPLKCKFVTTSPHHHACSVSLENSDQQEYVPSNCLKFCPTSHIFAPTVNFAVWMKFNFNKTQFAIRKVHVFDYRTPSTSHTNVDGFKKF